MIGITLSAHHFFVPIVLTEPPLLSSLKWLQQQLLFIFFFNKIICCQLNTQSHVKEHFSFEWHFSSRWCGKRIQFRMTRTPKAQPCWDVWNDSLSHNSFQYFFPAFNFCSFFDQGPQLGGLFVYTGFLNVLKIVALISLIVNNQAVTAKQSGPLESVNMWLDLLIELEGRISDFQSQWFEWNTSSMRMRSLLNVGLVLSQKIPCPKEGGQCPQTSVSWL